MHAKAGTPPETIKRLNEMLVAAVKDPEVNAKLVTLGVQPVGSTPDELLKAQQAEYKLAGNAGKGKWLQRQRGLSHAPPHKTKSPAFAGLFN